MECGLVTQSNFLFKKNLQLILCGYILGIGYQNIWPLGFLVYVPIHLPVSNENGIAVLNLPIDGYGIFDTVCKKKIYKFEL